MPTKERQITRAKLAQYAGLLGRDSIAAQCLKDFDEAQANNGKPRVYLRNNGFMLVRRSLGKEINEFYG